MTRFGQAVWAPGRYKDAGSGVPATSACPFQFPLSLYLDELDTLATYSTVRSLHDTLHRERLDPEP